MKQCYGNLYVNAGCLEVWRLAKAFGGQLKYRAVPGGKSPACGSYLKAINQGIVMYVKLHYCPRNWFLMPWCHLKAEVLGWGEAGREGLATWWVHFSSQYELWSLLEQPSTALVLCSLLISAEFQLSTLYWAFGMLCYSIRVHIGYLHVNFIWKLNGNVPIPVIPLCVCYWSWYRQIGMQCSLTLVFICSPGNRCHWVHSASAALLFGCIDVTHLKTQL